MPLIRSEVEIAAPPAEVRKTFFDFANYPTWAKGHFTTIEVTKAKDSASNPQPGDSLKVVMPSATFTPTVTKNEPEDFAWLGSLPYIFSGEHHFRFTPSATTPGYTTFVHEENFTGLASFLMGETWSYGKNTQAGFDRFSAELKAEVEGK